MSEPLNHTFQEILVCNISHSAMQAQQDCSIAASEYGRPSVVFKPALSLDGNKWFALFGEDPQIGVVGIGDSPHEAMQAFDRAWFEKVAPKP